MSGAVNQLLSRCKTASLGSQSSAIGQIRSTEYLPTGFGAERVTVIAETVAVFAELARTFAEVSDRSRGIAVVVGVRRWYRHRASLGSRAGQARCHVEQAPAAPNRCPAGRQYQRTLESSGALRRGRAPSETDMNPS